MHRRREGSLPELASGHHKSKRITARFKGKSLKGPYGGSFCAPNRPDFNKCKS